jgi:tetratricopeptide (TPR) repeat protein
MTTTSQRQDLLLGILKETPADSFVIFAIAKEYENIGNQNEAIQYYQKLYQLDPNYVGLYFHWGKLHEEINDSGKAIEIYSMGIEVASLQKDGHAERELRAAKYNCELLQ